MKAAIYARKSNDEPGKPADDKSVERQVAHAREYIARKGWSLAGEEHVYIDDGISGAEFKNRPALSRLLNRLKDFDAIVVSEQSRLGREISQTSTVIARIVSRGVRLFSYLDDRELRFESAQDKIMVNLMAGFAEMERELAAQRARDAALKRAREGRNFGGRAYGYLNIWRLADGTEQVAPMGEPKPLGAQTGYRINEEEAKVVRGIWQMYADGHGQKSIAFTLNGAPAKAALLRRYFGGVRPPAPRGTAACWSPNTIHDIVRNQRYRGYVPFGATRKTLNIGEGTRQRVKGDEILTPMKGLQIIPDALADAVARRTDRMRSVYQRAAGGRLGGRPDLGMASRYLLSGLVRCEACGSSMIMSSYWTGSGRGRRQRRCYVCNFRSNRGPTACSNAIRPQMENLDRDVLDAIERQVLTPAVIRAAASRAAELIRERTARRPDTLARITRELAKAERERENLVAAIASGHSKPEILVAAIAERDTHVEALKRDLAELESPPLLDELADRRLERQLEDRAKHWREVLAGDVPLARQALRALMAGPIWLRPGADGGYRLRGATRLGALWPESRVQMASPRGFEPRLPP